MSSVTFPTEYGGTGQTFNDDSFRNGGHRQNFIPALDNARRMAGFTKSQADITNADRIATTADRNAAQTARTQAQMASVTSVNAANTAVAAADSAQTAAEQAAQNASAIYQSVAEGLSNTSSGEYFKVPEQSWIQLYRNNDGSAHPVFRLASQDELERLNTRLDPMLTSLLFS